MTQSLKGERKIVKSSATKNFIGSFQPQTDFWTIID